MNFFNDADDVDVFKGIVAGVAGGILASFLMEQFQAAWSATASAIQGDDKKKSGKKSEPTTVKAADLLSSKISGRKIPKDYRLLAGEAVHYGIGASSAALYGIAAEISPMVTFGDGTAFGAALWLIADEVAVPASGLSKPPQEIPVSTHIYALVSHLVYGWITELVRRAVRSAL